mgnify:CR=1 FL=1
MGGSGATDGGRGDDATGPGLPWQSATFYVIVATSMVVPLDVPFVSPTLPVVAEHFSVTGARASFVLSAYAAPGILSTPVFGVVADRYGRRPVLVTGLLLYGVFGVSVGFAETFTQVLALRVLQGILGASVLTTIALTLVGDRYEGPRRDATMGVATGVTALGAAVYPAIGGALAEISWNAPFFGYAVTIPVAVLAFFALKEPPVDPFEGAGLAYFREALESLPRRRATLLFATSIAAALVTFGAIFAGATFMLAADYGLSAGRIGLYTGATLFATAVVSSSNGRLSRYADHSTLIALGFVGYSVGLVGTWAASSPRGVLLALLVVGTAHGLVLPTVPSALSALAPGRFRGGVLSVRTSLLLVSQTVGPPLFTAPAVALGYGLPLLVAGVVAGLVGSAALLVLWRR